MEKNVFIFDFDGVIADSFWQVVQILNSLADQYHYKKKPLELAEELKEYSTREFYMDQFGIHPIKLLFIARQAKKRLHEQIGTIKPVIGMPEVLKEMRFQCQSMGIITSNSVENVKAFLTNHQIDIFDFVISGNIFLKFRDIRQCVKKYHFDPEHVYYIGDETRDIDAARRSRTKAVSVSWGYATHRLLETYQPDFLFDSPKELLALLK